MVADASIGSWLISAIHSREKIVKDIYSITTLLRMNEVTLDF